MSFGEFKPEPIKAVPVPKPAPTLESMANERAEADPFPGPLVTAFSKGSIKAAGFHVRKFVAIDHIILKRLDSPIRRMILELAKPAELQEPVEATEQEEWDLCLQFTIPARDADALSEQGKEAFQSASKASVGLEWEPESVQFVLAAIFTQLKRNIETAQKYAAEAKENGEITFFDETTG